MTDVITLTEADFDQEVLASDVPVVVDYWTPSSARSASSPPLR